MLTFAQRIVAQAQHQFEIQGYVRFSDITKAEGVSRQRTDQGFQQAVKNKLITEEQLKDWKQSYKLRTTRAEFALSRTNEKWLKDQASQLDLSWHDVLNRVLHAHIHNENSCLHPTAPAS